jgi:hypothetical protein
MAEPAPEIIETAHEMVKAASRKSVQPIALLIFPPIYEFALYDLYIKPYALLRIGHWLVNCGYRVELLNCLDYQDPMTLSQMGAPKRRADGTGKFFRTRFPKPTALQNVPRPFFRYGIAQSCIEARLKKSEPDLILISSGLTYWYLGVQEVVTLCKHLRPHVPVVVGGTYATLCPEHCRQVIAPDYVIKGEAFPELLPVLEKLGLPRPGEPLTEDFLFCPEVLREAAVVRLNNGCPFRCAYSASHQLSGNFKTGDPERLFRQVYELATRLSIRHFSFLDDALLYHKEKSLIPFLKQIIASRLQINFYTPNALHLNQLDEELALLMKQAGFRNMHVGFESANPLFHQTTDQKLEVTKLRQGINALKKAGFTGREIKIYLLAGLPGQNWQEVEESIRYAAACQVKVYLSEFSPVPGTPLWEESVRLSAYPLAAEPLTHNNSIFPMEWSGFPLAQLSRLKRLTHELAALEQIN